MPRPRTPKPDPVFILAALAALTLTAAGTSAGVENDGPPRDLLRAPLAGSAVQEVTTRFSWPLAWPFGHPRLRITNYMDHAPTTPVRLDYMGGDLTYNGHLGTDINLNSFHDMDEGVPILAAANGRVVYVHDTEYDRQVSAPQVQGNGVIIAHEDGTTSLYWHMRTNSAMVRVGEYVREGQPIGFVGSAGFTLMPHLHFEVTAYDGSGTRDPFTGTANPLPSLWKHQEDYVGDDSFRLLDVGVTTGPGFSEMGSLIDWSAFKERPTQPVVVGSDEPGLRIWTLVFGQTGDPYSLEIHRPDGSLYGRSDAAVPTRDYGTMWQYWDIPFAGTFDRASFGEWSVEVDSHGFTVGTDRFVVGETSRYAPRFRPFAGHSFRLSGERQIDMPTLSYLGAPIESLTFALENPPANVSLTTDEFNEPIVTIDPATPDLATVRSREFALVATDPDGRSDRMHYHLVNDAASTLGGPPVVSAPSSVSAVEGDTVFVDVSASDPDGDAIELTATGLGGVIAADGGTFTTDASGHSGRLVWPTRSGDAGVYDPTFFARTSFGAIPSWGYPAIVQVALAETEIRVAPASLQARAFTSGESKILRLFSEEPVWWAGIELPDGRSPLEIDVSSIELVSEGTGSVSRIPARSDKRVVIGDRDRNSIPDLLVGFAGSDMRRLFDSILGRRSVQATIEGRLHSGMRFSAPVSLDVIGEPRDLVTVAPNPMNPEAVLTVRTSRAGPIRAQVYDTQGRLVRTLLDVDHAEAGTRSVRFGVGDGAVPELGSGVYFFRVSTVEGTSTGRFVVLK